MPEERSQGKPSAHRPLSGDQRLGDRGPENRGAEAMEAQADAHVLYLPFIYLLGSTNIYRALWSWALGIVENKRLGPCP